MNKIAKHKLILLISIALILFSPFFGINFLNPFTIVENDNFNLFLNLRLVRTITAFACGSILALSGLIFQSTLQNPLASPYTLGISSAAAFGVSICVWLKIDFLIIGNINLSSLSAFICSLLLCLILILISKKSKIQRMALILFGLLFSFFISSLLLLLQYFFDYSKLLELTRWLSGSVANFSYFSALLLLFSSLIYLCLMKNNSRDLDIIALGHDSALSHGINVEKKIGLLIAISTFVVALSVSICGPIAFVGIIVPHIARAICGFSHRTAIFYSWLIGGNLLIVSDVLARVLMPPFELPIGLITSLFGVPIFAFILLRKNYA